MQPALSSAKWYQHITEVPLSRFVDCLVDDNYAALVITGYPTPEELQEAWLQIQSEYAEAIGNHDYRMYVNLMKDMILLSTTLEQINCLVGLLEAKYRSEFLQLLNKLLNTSITLDPADPVKYKAALKGAIMRSKAIKINLDLKGMQMKDIQSKMSEPGKKPERGYFHSILVTLSDHAKYHISDSIPVFEFCDRIKRFNQYCEQVKKQNNGRRTHR
jgi:hypothetical protein